VVRWFAVFGPDETFGKTGRCHQAWSRWHHQPTRLARPTEIALAG
jgi:hypothetical protein